MGGVEFDLIYGFDDVEVAGESYRRDAFARIFTAAGMPLGGQMMRVAAVIPEPLEDHPNAVAVYIEGLHVGYIPHGEAPEVRASAREQHQSGRHLTVPARVWASSEDGVWRARVTLRFSGREDREWAYADEPLSDDSAFWRLTERARLARLGDAEAAAQAGGFEIASLRPEIERAKKARDNHLALGLLLVCVNAAEMQAQAAQRRPVAWPTEQAAMVLHWFKDYDREIALLERYINADPEGQGTKAIRDRMTLAHNYPAREHSLAELRDKEGVLPGQFGG